MPRSDDDSWDITESVGSTALGVAAARAAETASEDPLIHDPFARMFVEAAGTGTWQFYTDPALREQLLEIEPQLRTRMQVMVDFMAVRTAFFDEFFLDAAKSGVRQVVILAAGLDARAWRLPWPERTTVYELDRAKVLEFKSATLQRQGARPTSTLVNVPVDLRQDWPTVLQEAGFDASQPSVWSAEGLVRYLPARAQDLLFERIDALSPVGSRLAVNTPSKNFLNPDLLARQRQLAGRYQAAAAQLINTEIPDTEDLWYREERTDLPEWLRERGWDVSETTMAEMLGRYGRSIPEDGVMAPTDFIAAERSA